ncbi:MAG: TetR/AcrR family transcriptional regulator [Verrucomicrobiota bacterium]
MSVTTARKAREREKRQTLIVEKSDELLKEHGYHGFNLDRLAERVEYSKGTLYQHFESKEDIVLAVVIEHIKYRAELFKKASEFQGRARERMTGVGMADSILVKLVPHSFALNQFVQTPSVWERTSDKMRDLAKEMMCKVGEPPQTILRDAVSSGDLPKNVVPHSVMAGLICLAKGTHLMSQAELVPCGELQKIAPQDLPKNYDYFLDGVGWGPSSKVWDYTGTRRRLRDEVFHSEMAKITKF